MSKHLGTLLAAIATSGLVLISSTASFAGAVRDHRNDAGKMLSGRTGRGGGCYRCLSTSSAQGGVVVTHGGKVVGTKVMPAPGGTYGRGGGGRR